MTISVLICTYNRPTLLEQCLISLLDCSIEKPDQVVVVNGGDERADVIVSGFQEGYPHLIELVKTVNKNLAASRNIGLNHCESSIVAMTDDDAEVFPDWVTRAKVAHAENPQSGAVGGPVLGSNTESLVGKVADAITFPSWPSARSVRSLPGVNISYKREVLEQIGEQDETLFRGEDVDFNWRVKQLGYDVLFDPDIKVYHHHRPTLRGLLNQRYMYGRAYYLVRRKWPEMYAIYPRKLLRSKDLLKVANCLLLPFYHPFVNSRRLDSVGDKVKALPILFLTEVAWEGGIVVQWLRERFS